ncbi:hypothetical protein JOC95_000440 [Bacillus tianshenii]|uniref:Uncharacterized protein n=1 Tax=Sutcliffiella tianshenii TaxID=1463404 RepID=A0ABS2NW03_9BACI|nr:hypothetical protein [Bacillus tianshenii]MBM7618598.1 hypothetical protein [Bacillus tianshenii]
MKYTPKQFTPELLDKIKQTEQSLGSLLEEITQPYKNKFHNKGLELDSSFDQEGTDPFGPGYRSSLNIGISETGGDLLDLHTIVIWECQRTLLGNPIGKNIPGSRISGEFMDETINEINGELQAYLKEWLN